MKYTIYNLSYNYNYNYFRGPHTEAALFLKSPSSMIRYKIRFKIYLDVVGRHGSLWTAICDSLLLHSLIWRIPPLDPVQMWHF